MASLRRHCAALSGCIIVLMLVASGVFAACGERGGPGYRGPDGHCVGWANLKRVCGDPPTTRCTPEMVANAPMAALPGAQSLTPSIPPPAEALPAPKFDGRL
jgi:hypothetical protein